MKEFQISGRWWLPDSPEVEHGGVLTFAFGRGLSLAVFGGFNRDVERGTITHYDVIHGIANAQFVSLFDCSVVARNLQQPTNTASGRISTEWSINVALQSRAGHFANGHRFHTASVELGYLRYWLDKSGVTDQESADDDELYGFTVSFQQPEPVRAVADGMQVAIELHASPRFSTAHGVRITESVQARITVDQALTVDEWLSKVVEPLRNLLNLATGAYNHLIEMDVYDPGDRDDPGRRPGTRVVHSRGNHGVPPLDVLPPDLMLFSASHVADRFSEILARWLTLGEALDSVFGLFFGVQYSGQAYPEYRFYSMVQALESYHRRRRRNYVLSGDAHRERLDSIMKAVPAEHADWLSSKLQYSNEPSLKGRLTELTEEWRTWLDPLVGNRRRFVRSIVDTRNYYTHYSEELRGRAATGDALKRITDILFIGMQACLLAELGFSHQECDDLIRTSADYWQMTDPPPGSFPPRVDPSRIIHLRSPE